jgi:hypothetical protein
MACRGVLFAVTDEMVESLLAASSDEQVREIVESVEEEWDEEHLAETDKAWDAIHRALTDGSLAPAAGSYPLNRAILGGRHLHQGDDYIVALVSKNEVGDVADALSKIDQRAFQERYRRLVPKGYAPEYGDEDLAYSWAYFEEVLMLYARAQRARRAVIFTADQ